MNAEQMWKEYCGKTGTDPETEYEAWQFGSDADSLASLVMQGVKTATASGYELYEADGEPVPKAGEYSVILNTKEEAVCIIKDVRVTIVPYKDVTEEQAYKEGEGDRSLAYWREVHLPFFLEQYSECGIAFSEESRIVCEEFEVVYRPDGVKEKQNG